MKIIAFFTLTLAAALSSFARTSEFVILTPALKDARHKAYHPRIIQNPTSKEFVNVRIPWEDDGKSYWLVLARQKLPDEELEFRGVIGGAGMPPSVLAFSPLTQQGKWIGGRYEARPGFIEFTLHKSLVGRAYIYHDFSNPRVLDGGFYYTIKLDAYTVEQIHADDASPAP